MVESLGWQEKVGEPGREKVGEPGTEKVVGEHPSRMDRTRWECGRARKNKKWLRGDRE